MVKFNLNFFGWIIGGLFIGTFLVFVLIGGGFSDFNYQKVIENLPKTIGLNGLIWFVFSRWGWKWSKLNDWLVPFPDLSGEWEGEIISNWINPETQSKLPPIKTTAKITQTFFTTAVEVKTGEMTSLSKVANFNIDKDRDRKELYYSYESVPKRSVRDRSEIHYGTTMLIITTEPTEELNGEYWTTRETTGEISLRRKI